MGDLLLKSQLINLNHHQPTYIYNYYNLDPYWDNTTTANRVLLLEPSIFKQYPIAERPLKFALKLAKNIQDIQIFVGEFEELKTRYQLRNIIYKEHPLNDHYSGKMI